MRIHSKFQDYYDSCLGYGIDEQCHYVRHTEEISDNKSRTQKGITQDNEYSLVRDLKLPYFDLDNRRWRGDANSNIDTTTTFYILFCGKLYIYAKFSVFTDKGRHTSKDIYCYSVDDVEKVVKEFGSKKENENWLKKEKDKYARFRRSWNSDPDLSLHRPDIEKMFERQGEETNQYVDIHHETGIPVIGIVKHKYGKTNKVVMNPVLKDIQFYKAVDAFQAFQELSMFISGVLGGQSPKMIEVSNEVKIHKAGFDKHSFRKMKETND